LLDDYLFKTCIVFVLGKPSALYKDTDPDWVPSVNMGYSTKPSSGNPEHRHGRLHSRKENIKKRDCANTLVELSSCFEEGTAEGDMDVDQDPEPTILEQADAEISRLTERLEQADTEITMLKVENQKLKDDNESLTKIVHKMKATTPEDFENDNDKVRYYTGLKSFVSLMGLLSLLSREISE
jgi:FtsZ-binding cell division protein ZapB